MNNNTLTKKRAIYAHINDKILIPDEGCLTISNIEFDNKYENDYPNANTYIIFSFKEGHTKRYKSSEWLTVCG